MHELTQAAGADMTHRFTPLQALVITAPTILFGIYYLRRSMRLGNFAMLVFLVSIAYGLSVELLDIRTTETYFYTDLQLMLGRDPNWVPFSVGVSWAAILFIAMSTSDRLGLPVAWRPLFDGAVALSLDFVMDPVASASVWVPRTGASCADVTSPPFGGVGMWTWCVPEQASALWYSVPLANFTGWFLVVGCMSAAVRIARGPLRAERHAWPVQLLLLVVLAAAAALAVLGAARIYPRVLQSPFAQYAVLWTLFLAPIIAVVVMRKRLTFDQPLDKGLLALPALILVSETGTFFVRGIDRARWPGSAALLVLFALLSAGLLLLPYLRRPARAT
jgi:hypothetical protein